MELTRASANTKQQNQQGQLRNKLSSLASNDLLCRDLTTRRSGPPGLDSLYETDDANERKNGSD